jgi:hypothetical protein
MYLEVSSKTGNSINLTIQCLIGEINAKRNKKFFALSKIKLKPSSTLPAALPSSRPNKSSIASSPSSSSSSAIVSSAKKREWKDKVSTFATREDIQDFYRERSDSLTPNEGDEGKQIQQGYLYTQDDSRK